MKPVYFRALGALAILFSVTACSIGIGNKTNEDDPGPAPARDLSSEAGEAGDLFRKARSSLEKGRFDTAVLEYESLEATYPFGEHAAQARLDVAYAYFQQDELDNSIATLDRFLKLYPQSDQADYAYYLKGLVNSSRGTSLLESVVPRKLDQLDQAFLRASVADYATLERRYPDSPYAAEATTRRIRLIDHMARHELNTAKFYFNRSAMVATINRVNAMMEQFPESSLNQEGLELLAQAHRALGNETSANEVEAILKERFPDSTDS